MVGALASAYGPMAETGSYDVYFTQLQSVLASVKLYKFWLRANKKCLADTL